MLLITMLSFFVIGYNQEKKAAISHMDETIAINRIYIEKWFFERAGDIRYIANQKSTREMDPERIQQSLLNAKISWNEFDTLHFVNLEGIIEISTEQDPRTDVSDREYYKEAMQGREAISDVLIGKSTGLPLIVFACPVYSFEDEIMGVVIGSVNLKSIDGLLGEIISFPGRDVYLLDQRGNMISQSKYNNESKNHTEIFFSAIKGVKQNTPYTNYAGEKVFGSYTWTNSGKWILVSEITRLKVLSSLLQQFFAMSSALLAMSGILVFFTLKLSNKIETQLNHLIKGTEIIGQGDYHHRISEKELASSLEMMAICRAFNSMAETIYNNIQLLEQSREKYKASNRDLQEFAYVASHDLQEPLRMVTSYLQLIESRYKGKLDSDADDFINYAVNGAKRMQKLITDLLAYSRISTKEDSFKKVSLEGTVKKVLDNLELAIVSKNAKVIVESLPIVDADETQMLQLFQNLISNGIKFNTSNRPLVKISSFQDKNTCTIAVSDNGIGIQPKHFDRIFSIFQRLHTHYEYEGTGMGLSICKKIVARHGGTMWLESEEGAGTVFYVRLPLVRSD